MGPSRNSLPKINLSPSPPFFSPLPVPLFCTTTGFSLTLVFYNLSSYPPFPLPPAFQCFRKETKVGCEDTRELNFVVVRRKLGTVLQLVNLMLVLRKLAWNFPDLCPNWLRNCTISTRSPSDRISRGPAIPGVRQTHKVSLARKCTSI